MFQLTAKLILAAGILNSGYQAFGQEEQPSSASPSPASAAPAGKNRGISLEAAWKRELIFINNEERLLKKRLANLEKVESAKIRKIENRIKARQAGLLSLKQEARTLEARLEQIRLAGENREMHKDQLKQTLYQAGITLEERGHKGEVKTGMAALEAGLQILEDNRLLRRSRDSFYLPDGEKVTGEITWLGSLAAFGSSDKGGGGLIPAGNGRLKVFAGPGGQVLPHPADSRNGSLRAWIFRSASKPVILPPEKTLAGFFRAGGPVGMVISGLGLLALIAIILKLAILLRASREHDELAEEINAAIQKQNYERSLELAEKARGISARILTDVLQQIKRGRAIVEDVVSESFLREAGSLEKFNTLIPAAAAAAPLLGLLGTVTGMIATFDIITESGTGDPAVLSGGISEALVTTMMGLIVAIPALLSGNLLNARAAVIRGRMETLVLQASNAFGEEDGEEQG